MAYTAIPPTGGGAGNQWFNDRVTEMQSVLPTLTTFSFRDFVNNATPSATFPTTFAASVEGGAVSPLASASATALGGSVFQTPRTGTCAITFRAQFLAIAGAGVAEIGFTNSGNTHPCGVFTTDPGTSNKYQLECGGGTGPTTIVADTSWHNFMLALNGATIRVYVDNVLGLTSATMPTADEAVYPYFINTVSTKIKCEMLAIGYILP